MSPKPLLSSGPESALDTQRHPISQEGLIDLPVLPGEVIAGKYEVIARIGAGGMGQVFSALHRDLGERVALKFLRREALAHRELLQRFATEARAAARIRSEHVARVFDVGQLPSGIPYMVMELLEGETLADALASRGALPVEAAVDYVLQVCEALASAHAKGIIHRDIKPDNLFLIRNGSGPRTIKVLDFGVSKLALGNGAFDADRQHVRTTLPVGSPAYMSPEQLRDSAEVDPRTDVWSLGCALFELLTGAMPFDAPTLIQLGAAILEQQPIPLRKLCSDMPEELERVIACCLEKDPSKRFQNVAELAKALSPFASERARIYVERCQFLLPDGVVPAFAPRVELRRSVRSSLPNDPATTVPAIQRAQAPVRKRVARAALISVLAASGLLAAYALGRRSDAAFPATDTLVMPVQTAAALTPSAADAPTITAAVEAPLAEGRPDVVSMPEMAPARPSARAKPAHRKPAAFGRTADEFDVGY